MRLGSGWDEPNVIETSGSKIGLHARNIKALQIWRGATRFMVAQILCLVKLKSQVA